MLFRKCYIFPIELPLLSLSCTWNGLQHTPTHKIALAVPCGLGERVSCIQEGKEKGTSYSIEEKEKPPVLTTYRIVVRPLF